MEIDLVILVAKGEVLHDQSSVQEIDDLSKQKRHVKNGEVLRPSAQLRYDVLDTIPKHGGATEFSPHDLAMVGIYISPNSINPAPCVLMNLHIYKRGKGNGSCSGQNEQRIHTLRSYKLVHNVMPVGKGSEGISDYMILLQSEGILIYIPKVPSQLTSVCSDSAKRQLPRQSQTILKHCSLALSRDLVRKLRELIFSLINVVKKTT
ncbi:hypothetical protein J6590_082407 [Homalodisca vitripennis]|nr:hypothetical protein J6590_082407 [Homalodisca vitripennis]